MVFAGKRCRSGGVAAGQINVILCGVRLLATLVLLACVPCARLNSGMGTRWVIGRDTMGPIVVQGEPCRIMARVSGAGVPVLGVRAVGTSGRRPR